MKKQKTNKYYTSFTDKPYIPPARIKIKANGEESESSFQEWLFFNHRDIFMRMWEEEQYEKILD